MGIHLVCISSHCIQPEIGYSVYDECCTKYLFLYCFSQDLKLFDDLPSRKTASGTVEFLGHVMFIFDNANHSGWLETFVNKT